MTDLTDRMRTCAAYIMEYPRGEPMPTDRAELDEVQARIELVLDDAVALLLAAATEIELLIGPIVPGHSGIDEPMEVIPPVVTPPPVVSQTSAMWVAPGGSLPGVQHSGTVSPRACPQCDSRASKRVNRVGGNMMLTCPTCGHQWQYHR